MSPVEQPTPPDSPRTPASSLGLGALFRTPGQTIVEIEDDETMEEGEITDSNPSAEEGQILEGTKQSTPDSINIRIPCVPSEWLQPSSP